VIYDPAKLKGNVLVVHFGAFVQLSALPPPSEWDRKRRLRAKTS
jgi:hypothetical protein